MTADDLARFQCVADADGDLDIFFEGGDEAALKAQRL